MPIEINGSLTPQTGRAGESGTLKVVRNDAATPAEAGKEGGADSVRLTGVAALLQRLDSRISALPVVDTARVNAIRQSIADGSFDFDPARVADKLIEHEIALLGRVPVRAGHSE